MSYSSKDACEWVVHLLHAAGGQCCIISSMTASPPSQCKFKVSVLMHSPCTRSGKDPHCSTSCRGFCLFATSVQTGLPSEVGKSTAPLAERSNRGQHPKIVPRCNMFKIAVLKMPGTEKGSICYKIVQTGVVQTGVNRLGLHDRRA